MKNYVGFEPLTIGFQLYKEPKNGPFFQTFKLKRRMATRISALTLRQKISASTMLSWRLIVS